MNELDDDIVDVKAPEAGQDDDILEVAPPESVVGKLGSRVAEKATPLLDTLNASNDYVTETAQDFGTGAAKGLTMGALDELHGLLGAGLETGAEALGIGPGVVDEELAAQGFKGLEPQSFLDKYREHQQISERTQDEAAKRSPIAETIGQVAGGITSSAGLGGMLGLQKAAVQGPKALFGQVSQNQGLGKAAMDLLRGTATTGSRVADMGVKGLTTAASLAPAIATESALTSKAHLIGEDANPEAVGADVIGGLSFGIPAALGLGAAADTIGPKISQKGEEISRKIGEAFQDEGNPRLRQIARAYEHYGKNLGISPRSHGEEIAGRKFAQIDQTESNNIKSAFDQANSQLGADVGSSIDRATTRGAIVNINPAIQDAAKRIIDLTAIIPQLGESRKTSQVYDKILNRAGTLTPTEAKVLVDDLDNSIGLFKSAAHEDPAAKATLQELFKFRRDVSNTLKQQVPEYAQAASRFENFRQILDQIASGARKADVSETYFGNLNKGDQKIYDNILNMIQHVQRPAQSSGEQRTAFTNFMDALKNFEMNDAQRVANDPKLVRVLPDSEQIRKAITNASDDSVLRSAVRSTTESRSVLPDWKEALIGKAPASGAYLAGRATKGFEKLMQKSPIQGMLAMSKAVYNAPAQSLGNLASKLESSGQFQSVGKALRESLQDGNSAKKNAALFTIMQNPNSRAFISAEDFPETENEE